ncbi:MULTISPECIES: hypothetical protein [Bacillaceae]|uniref:Uncharacterized protein n=1 Tax=Evansella alkalicola TaxID=745819 RepID=A0ABS6JPN2_9BACI|nr:MULTISPECIES: hypothetical protein [Bacillaceae]MBU9720523.1 hypothetical protein [Bacillus alkalicola]
MKQRRIKWIFILTTFFLVTVVWSLSYAHLSKATIEEKNEDLSIVQKEAPMHMITELFLSKNIQIGSHEEELYQELGEPLETGMYNGGYYFAYDILTYFVNPDSEKVNAMAFPGEALDLAEWQQVEAEIQHDLKYTGLNEMDGLWNEIYDWEEYDLMIERDTKEEGPMYLWLMEDSLFYDETY